MQKKLGIKLDTTKPDTSLIPASAILEEAALWTFGKSKYEAFNWHKGIDRSRIIAALERHITLYKAGLNTDYETKKHHMAAVRCAAAMLIQFDLEGRPELEDRLQLDETTKAKIEAMAKGEFVWDLAAPQPEESHKTLTQIEDLVIDGVLKSSDKGYTYLKNLEEQVGIDNMTEAFELVSTALGTKATTIRILFQSGKKNYLRNLGVTNV